MLAVNRINFYINLKVTENMNKPSLPKNELERLEALSNMVSALKNMDALSDARDILEDGLDDIVEALESIAEVLKNIESKM